MRLLPAVLVLVACGSKAPPATSPSNTSDKTAATAPTRTRDPYKASTWVAKLGDPKESERAVTELEQLGDPAAIKPLGDAWLAQGRPVRLLQVMISLARPLTPAEAKATFVTDYEATGRPANWDQALPYLGRALTEVDEANPRSVDSAIKAADALGDAKQGLAALAAVAGRPVTKKLIAAQVSAIRAIGAFSNDKATASVALLQILARDLPPHPRTAKDREQGRILEERYGLFLASSGAAINALAALQAPVAAKALVLVMYRTPELFTQVRRALVATGPKAEVELRAALRGESAEVNQLFKDGKLDQYCGDHGDEPCQPVSSKEFYPAVVLGDFHDPAAVPDLLAVLKHPAVPAYYVDDQAAPTTQYSAVFDALRKIGAADTSDKVRGLWTGKGDLTTRILAISAYPFVARDDAGTAMLGKIAADNAADDGLRVEAATAFARMSHDLKDIAVLNMLAKKYLDASAKKAKEAEGQQKQADAADRAYEAAKLTLDKVKSDLLAMTKDSSRTAQELQAATAAAKKAEDDFRLAKKKHKEQVAPWKQLDSAAKAYTGYARMFQTHIARIEVAVRCKTDLACFAGTLKLGVDDAAAYNAPYIADLKAWNLGEKRDLVAAAIDRAMLELGKQGAKAAPFTDALLDAAVSDDHQVRLAVLLALPKVATLPCASCEAKLDAAIRAGEGKSTLADLNLETQVLRNYFTWAGGLAN